MARQHQRFGLRKLSVGLASVLLGTSFIFGGSLVAHADSSSLATTDTVTQQPESQVDSTQGQENSAAQSTSTSKQESVDKDNAAVNSEAANDNGEVKDSSKQQVSSQTNATNAAAPTAQAAADAEPANTEQTHQVKIPFTIQYKNQDGLQTTTKDFTFDLDHNDRGYWEIPGDIDTQFYTFKKGIIDEFWDRGYTYESGSADSLGTGAHLTFSAADLQTLKNNHGVLPSGWYRPDGAMAIKFLEGRTITLITPTQKNSDFYKEDSRFIAAGVKKGDRVPGTSTQFLADVPLSDVQRDFTRTIVFHYWDGHTEVKQQVASVTRSLQYNLVTGILTGLDGEWHGQTQWDEYDLPNNAYLMHLATYHYPHPVAGESSLDAKTFDPNDPAQQDVTVDVYVGQPAHYTFQYVNALTGEKLTPHMEQHDIDKDAYLDPSWQGQTLADYIGEGDLDSNGQPSVDNYFAVSFNGYKLINYDQIAQQKINGEGGTITFKYAPLSPVVTNYVDEASGKVIYKGYIDNVLNNALPGQHYTTEKIDIPGYQFDHASANTSGVVGQYQKQGDENPITVTYYYKVIPGQERIAQYSVDGHRDTDQPERSFVPPEKSGTLKQAFDYEGWGTYTAYQKFLEDNNYAPLGGENNVDGYFTPYDNQIYFEYRRKQPVTVNYLKAIIKDGKVVDTTTQVAKPSKILVSADKTWRNWQTIDEEVDGYTFDHVELGEMAADGTLASGTNDIRVKGTFKLLPQQVNYYYLETAEPQTEEKTVNRVVHYVANDVNGQELHPSVTQQVTLTGTYYVNNGKRVSVTPYTKGGKTIYVATDSPDAVTETWTIKDGSDHHDVTTNSDSSQQFDFGKVVGKEAPDQLPDQDGKAADQWYHTATQNNEQETVDPNKLTFDQNGSATLDPVYLIYRQKGQYNIHYIDLDDGNKELTAHEVKNVGEGRFIGDTPDATSQLWKTYTDEGYVLDHVSDNAKDDKLGKQELTKGVGDQYVYLKHGKTTATTKTPEAAKKSTRTSVTRKIYYRDAQTGKIITIKDDQGHEVAPTVTQQVNYVRVPVYDSFNGNFLGFAALFVDPGTGLALLGSDGQPQVKKDDNGKPILMPKDSDGWVPTGSKEYPSKDSPDLSKYGYKKAQSLTQQNNKGDGGKVDSKAADPTKNGEDVNIYYFHDTATTNKPLAGIKHESLSKTFTRTVVYQGVKDGQTHDVNGSPLGTHEYKQTVTFTRHATIDKVTNQVVSYTDWQPTSTDQLPSVDSKTPGEVGYDSVDISSVPAKTVDPKSDVTDLGTIVVTYRMGQQHGSITYIDDTTGKTLDNVDKTVGEHGEPIQFSVDENQRLQDYLSQGYVLVSTDYKGNETFNQDDSKNNFVVHLTHGVVKQTEAKTINETVHYVYQDGSKAHDDYLATPLTFTHTVVSDQVTGKTLSDTWTPDQAFATVISPKITGYTPDQTAIDRQPVSHDDNDLVFTVVYTAVPKPVQPSTPSVKPDKPSTPVTPAESTTSSVPVGTVPVKENRNKQPLTTNNVATEQTPSVQAKTANRAKTAKLPQTGNQSSLIAAAGLALTGLAGLLGLGGLKKKND